MRLCDISLRNFRNYEELQLEFDPGVNLIVGDNAQGKTNLLEAIGYLGSGKSFRTQKNGELILKQRHQLMNLKMEKIMFLLQSLLYFHISFHQ